MTIQIGDKVPGGILAESTGFDAACPMRPVDVNVEESLANKKVVVFGLPGAYTPTCSAQHVPGYLESMDALKAKGVDEVWCVATNDGFVMAAWGRDLGASDHIRFLGDGSAKWAEALGLAVDLTERGMGIRMARFSMLVDNGIVSQLNIEEPGAFQVSDAKTLLQQMN